jgi:hypothetical protein
MAVELLTVIYYKYYNPNACSTFEEHSVFYCGLEETLYNTEGLYFSKLNQKEGLTANEKIF